MVQQILSQMGVWDDLTAVLTMILAVGATFTILKWVRQ